MSRQVYAIISKGILYCPPHVRTQLVTSLGFSLKQFKTNLNLKLKQTKLNLKIKLQD